MLRLANHPLPKAAQSKLRDYQDEIDGEPTFPLRVAAAKKKFSARNRLGNATFREVRSTLSSMCSGVQRCMYCEDSMADEVEHHRPKAIYPQEVFSWPNYLYACGPCNGPKNNQFFVVNGSGAIVDVRPPRDQPPSPPLPGRPAIIDPRTEDPMDTVKLDLKTFRFVASHPDPVERERAKKTLEVLTLNARNDMLIRARALAYQGFIAKLESYIYRKERSEPQPRLDTAKNALLNSPHPTVWEEMKRRRDRIPELKALFDKAPEAGTWSVVS